MGLRNIWGQNPGDVKLWAWNGKKEDEKEQILVCPVCGQEISAEERLLWQNGQVAACPACMAQQGFALRRLG